MPAYQMLDTYVKKADVLLAVQVSLLALQAPQDVFSVVSNTLDLVEIDAGAIGEQELPVPTNEISAGGRCVGPSLSTCVLP